MKKFIFCATLVALFTSCMKNDVEVDAVQRTEDFTATFEDGTRADLDGTAVVWNADDHLTIFTKTSHNRQYKVKDLSANGRSATFEYVGYTGSDKTAISNNYAVYPYDADATILGDVITTTLASEQIYNAECELTYALMSAKSATNNFSFVNSGALLRFNISTILPDTFDLNYIKVSSQSHNIAGEVTIDTNDHLAVVTNNGTNEITLAEINETIDSDVNSFYIAMPAMSFEKSDLSVTFSFADGDKTFALPAFDLEQGKIKSIDYTIKDADEFTGNTPGEDTPDTPEVGKEWVDLGLSVKWATCNVGANAPEEYGDYFAWGEISPKDDYTTQTYQYWTDYNGDGSWDSGEYSDLGDITGNPQYDAATANWGGAWRMPTKAEQEELLNNCTWEWTTLNGVNGLRVTGPNGNSIFLPAAGSRVGTSSYDVGSDGDYWSSTPGEGNDGSAYDLFFGSGFYDWLWINRRDGHSVRPVLE